MVKVSNSTLICLDRWDITSFVARKLLAFYNKMTSYHKELDEYARFSREEFTWWNVYLVNWAELSRWLLATVFFTQTPDICRCPNYRHIRVTEAPSPEEYLMPQVGAVGRKERGRAPLPFDCLKTTTKVRKNHTCTGNCWMSIF